MKKILILSITLLFTANISFAQTDGPSKKETFDFIVYMIGEASPYTIKDYSYENWTIELVYNGSIRTVTQSFSLNDLVSTKSNTSGNSYIVYLNFKKEIYVYNYINAEKRGAKETGITSTDVTYKNKEQQTKLAKSLNHWIKLNKVNTSLFDD